MFIDMIFLIYFILEFIEFSRKHKLHLPKSKCEFFMPSPLWWHTDTKIRYRLFEVDQTKSKSKNISLVKLTNFSETSIPVLQTTRHGHTVRTTNFVVYK